MPNTAEIERIVREVLAELASAPAPTPSASPAPSAPPPPSRPKSNHFQELVLASRLVTMNDISSRLAGVRRLVVRPGTVITPAVKEELAKRNIQAIFEAADKDGFNGTLKLAIIAARTKIDPEPLAAALKGDGIDVELHSSKCLLEATDRMAGEVQKPNTLGLMLTPYEAETLCLANRLPGTRAIAGRDAAQIAADAAAVGANVLIVNPKKIGPYAMRQIVNEFTRGGVRACPDVLKQRLT
jgi:hypothetical protein